MKILLNNREEHIPEIQQSTVSALMEYKKYTFPNIIVRINGVRIKKDMYASTTIQDGDRIEMIHMVSGG